MSRFRSLFLAALALLALATPATAFDQKTKWFSIVVASDGVDAHSPLYLSNGSKGVTLERYRSGDVTQQWALVQPDYPTAPAVTGVGPLDGITECTFDGCPFRGNAGRLLKIVNRASGGCLILGKSSAMTTPCESQGNTSTRQRWLSIYSPSELTGGNYTALISSNGQGKCLAADGARNKSPNLLRVGGGCGTKGGTAWPMQYTLQLAAELTCRTDWDWNICMVEGQGR